MKLAALVAASALVLSSHVALAQNTGGQAGAPGARGTITGDPAASTPTTGSSVKANPSGSGTSTSGGKDDNGDQGRDKMPESNQGVRPNNPDKKQAAPTPIFLNGILFWPLCQHHFHCGAHPCSSSSDPFFSWRSRFQQTWRWRKVSRWI